MQLHLFCRSLLQRADIELNRNDANEEHGAKRKHVGEWDTDPDDMLLVLLVHSDADGLITPDHAGRLADRLEGLLVNIEPNAFRQLCMRTCTEKFIAGLRRAAAAGDPVRFH